ncbi:MAG: D-glycero-beta-D-manno-heptose 1-phosphate adenylyltransferase [Deltaproteobacteria bacterium]|nr:D-glycero-beta-D-manno-heptose 1-phosphate adenylyltransferase [Deltaproteobacteria bacterium]
MQKKLIELEELAEKVRALRKAGKTIVFTNGCFDLLHVGHVRYLEAAKTEGDILVVGVNSDQSVQLIKGPRRPVVPENERSEVLASLGCVDYVTIFDDPDPLAVIKLLRPDVLVKGADWPEDGIVGKQVVEENGGRVVRVPLAEGASSTRLIERVLAGYH